LRGLDIAGLSVSVADRTIAFREREFRGSRLRCLLLTSDAPNRVAAFLSSLAAPYGHVTADDRWAPHGFLGPAEASVVSHKYLDLP
jgi:hypothetical protein